MIAKLSIRLYSIVAHALALAAMVYLIGFIGDVGVPWTIDNGAARPPVPVAPAMALDIALMALFALQHWGMRRYRGWARPLPAEAERPTYLIATVAALAALVALWRPIPHVVWAFDSDLAVYGLSLAYFAAWAMMLTGGFRMVRPCSLALSPTRATLGLRVASEASRPARRAWYVIPLITPYMTVGHLVFALGIATMVMLASILQDDEARAATLARSRARRVAARQTRSRNGLQASRLRALDREEEATPPPRPARGAGLWIADGMRDALARLRSLGGRNFAEPVAMQEPARGAAPAPVMAAAAPALAERLANPMAHPMAARTRGGMAAG